MNLWRRTCWKREGAEGGGQLEEKEGREVEWWKEEAEVDRRKKDLSEKSR